MESIFSVPEAFATTKALMAFRRVSGLPFHLRGKDVMLVVNLPLDTSKVEFLSVLIMDGVPPDLVEVADRAYLTSVGCPCLRFMFCTNVEADEFRSKIAPLFGLAIV